MKDIDSSKSIVCRLTNSELQKHKGTVIAKLKEMVLEKKELENGFSYRFLGSDEALDMLVEFIKAERMCCDFFDFKLLVSNDYVVVLEITGSVDVKEFIKRELGM